ncbi:phytoene desaturase family protein [Pseudobacteriovorax antillogorgiicola]|uniref:All-trans-retinol 13,14-reductase n=1 Tax=Pseudobacteriovorax antillogorgiicola TaxID=1513793 RepID=A0A1Y6CSI4_9BACT|nr:NAD(P)/FAD-dependent oxidoreductase [Pseudobacteriovorax antillogorgiicola]TCS45458.1 all-trans-retinol 13,14-reductase [Pseudobacteriovorax antillogorgiicola]SMF74726.1 all-trans-retinol 13,14-reductase [Pseudobacteriovorax antillogorgiicola]
MNVGTAWHRASIDDQYDCIVVGSGMGGLATAACLSKAGQKVLVLEKHYTAGGFTHTFQRKGYEWDVGVHYIGEVHRKHSVMRRVFDYVSDGALQWSEMPPVYDRIYLGPDAYDYVAGPQQFKERMVSYFPKEERAIEQYVDMIRQVSRVSSGYFMEKTLPIWLSKILYNKLTRDYLKLAKRSTYDVLRSMTQDETLIAVLTGQWGDYGLPPKASSFAMHATVAKHFLAGGNYPVGGSSSIARTIEPVIQKSGGQVITNAGVEKVLIKDGRACGVLLENGREIRAKRVVSAIGISNSYSNLIESKSQEDNPYTYKEDCVSPSFSHVCLYIGIKANGAELGFDNANLWVYRDRDHDGNVQAFKNGTSKEFPIVYISFPSSKDPDWETNYPGRSTIEIVAPAPYEWFEPWKEKNWQKRGAEYNELKSSITERLLDALYEKLPQLKGKVDYTELSTPLSTEHFCSYSRGEIYGLDHTPERFEQRWLRARPSIKNLYFTGQDLVTCGVGGALSAGVLTSIAMLGPRKGMPLLQLMSPQKSKS